MLNAFMEQWAVLLGPTNQKYNTCDNSAFYWESAWPRVAGWYGIAYKGPQDGDKYTETETPFVPRGYGSKGITRRKLDMVEWAKRDDVKKAWGELEKEHDLTQKELVDIDRNSGCLDVSLCLSAPLHFSYV